jgi:hypothetical protein
MSKGGAGKVYFVLYLAVILELLIIIVERDEAEEHLMAKQRESMKIVQSILSQLQTGSGVEGLSTRPQDQIVLTDRMPPGTPGLDLIEQERVYQVDVGVTDVISDLTKVINDDKLDPKAKAQRLRDFVRTSNVRDLQYQIWFTPAKDSVPKFPTDEEIGDLLTTMGDGFREASVPGYNWTLKGLATMQLDTTWLANAKVPIDNPRSWFSNASTAPVYTIKDAKGAYANFAPADKIKKPQFQYNHAGTIANGGGESNLKHMKVRTFTAGFKPAGGSEGIYKLHFYSRTNKIMGIRNNGPNGASSLSDEMTVNIGTLQLKVKDLKSVIRDLDKDADPRVQQLTVDYLKERRPRKYFKEVQKIVDSLNLKNPDKANNAKLYGYINMILYGGSDDLEQNQASMGFTVRVLSPDVPQAEPFVQFENEKMYAYASVGAAFYVSTGPGVPGTPKPTGYVESAGKRVQLSFEPAGKVDAATAPGSGGATRWLAYSSEPLTNGEWKVSVTQSTGKQSKGADASIFVYPSTLKESDGSIYQNADLRLSRLYYGAGNYSFSFLDKAPDDNSFEKFNVEQYSLVVTSDKDAQGTVFRGINAVWEIREDVNAYTLTLLWKNLRGETVTLFSKGPINLLQKGPGLQPQASNVSTTQVGSTDFETTAIVKINPPANLADAKILKPTIVSSPKGDIKNLTGTQMSATIEEESPYNYRVRISITGDPDPEASSISGVVSLQIAASVRNPKNGKEGSIEAGKNTIQIPVNSPIERTQSKKTRKRR